MFSAHYEMAVEQIPVEVLEQIFSFLDGRSFSIAKQVCKSWHDVVKPMQVKATLWKDFCFNEIPQTVLEEILSFNKIPSADTVIDWGLIYKKWFQGRLITKAPYWKKIIHSFCSNPITCVKFSGSWVLTGHRNGFLCVWNQYSGSLHLKMPLHLKMITDMAVVDLLNLGSYYGSEDMPWSHHHLITISKDSYIQVKSLLEPIGISDTDIVLNYHSDVLLSVRVFGSKFAVSCRDNTITLWNMKVQQKPHFHLEISLLHSIIGPSDILLSFGFRYNEIQCISYAGRLQILTPDKGEWLEKRYFKYSCSENGPDVVVSVTAAFIFRLQIVIMLTADGKMVVSLDENRSQYYYLMQTLGTVLVSVSLFGTCLALGGENGKLFIFYILKDEDLIHLDLSNPSLTLTLSEASILSIDIMYDIDSPAIVATTTESIYVIKWYRTRHTHQEIKTCDLSNFLMRRKK